MLQDGGPRGAARDPRGAARDLPGAECVSASALSGRLVSAAFVGLLL